MTKITIERETLERAITALTYHQNQTRPIERTRITLDALRAALAAQPAEPVEPVAWLRFQEHADRPTTVHLCDSDHPRAFQVYAAQPAPAAVPPGYALVPIEPTPEICKIGGHVMSEWTDDSAPLRERTYAVAFADAYRAMIAAAGDNT